MASRLFLALLVVPVLGAALASSQQAPSDPPPPPPPTRTPTGTITGPPQSLADVARQSKEKKRAGLVITNETLKKKGSGSGSVSTIAIGGKPTPAPAAKAHEPAPVPAEFRDGLGRTEADWKALSKAGRDRIAAADESRRRLEGEAKRLENDFYAWSDGNYRDRVIRPAWDQAKEALNAAAAEGDAARKAYEALEEEARKAGTPPGWLR